MRQNEVEVIRDEKRPIRVIQYPDRYTNNLISHMVDKLNEKKLGTLQFDKIIYGIANI